MILLSGLGGLGDPSQPCYQNCLSANFANPALSIDCDEECSGGSTAYSSNTVAAAGGTPAAASASSSSSSSGASGIISSIIGAFSSKPNVPTIIAQPATNPLTYLLIGGAALGLYLLLKKD